MPFKLTGWILEPGKVETSKLAYLPTWDGWFMWFSCRYFLYQLAMDPNSWILDPSYGFGILDGNKSFIVPKLQRFVGSAHLFGPRFRILPAGMGFFGCSLHFWIRLFWCIRWTSEQWSRLLFRVYFGDHTTQIIQRLYWTIKGIPIKEPVQRKVGVFFLVAEFI